MAFTFPFLFISVFTKEPQCDKFHKSATLRNLKAESRDFGHTSSVTTSLDLHSKNASSISTTTNSHFPFNFPRRANTPPDFGAFLRNPGLNGFPIHEKNFRTHPRSGANRKKIDSSIYLSLDGSNVCYRMAPML